MSQPSRRPTPNSLRSRFATDPEMSELVELFVRELPSRMDAIRAAWLQGQTDRLGRMAHQLKGAGDGYGFPEISAAADSLESAARASSETDASERLRALEREVNDLAAWCARACDGGT